MQLSYIDPDAFDTAYELAISNIPEDRQNRDFISQFTQTFIREHARLRIPAILKNRKRETEKIRSALEDLEQRRGMDFILSNRVALLSALKFSLNTHRTFPAMPKSKPSRH